MPCPYWPLASSLGDSLCVASPTRRLTLSPPPSSPNRWPASPPSRAAAQSTRSDLLLCSLSMHRLHFALSHPNCTANLSYPSPLPVFTSELQPASYTPPFSDSSRQELHRTPTSPFSPFPEPSSPFPESSFDRTKLHRAAFVFTDDLHADSLPQRLPSMRHNIVSTLYLP